MLITDKIFPLEERVISKITSAPLSSNFKVKRMSSPSTLLYFSYSLVVNSSFIDLYSSYVFPFLFLISSSIWDILSFLLEVLNSLSLMINSSFSIKNSRYHLTFSSNSLWSLFNKKSTKEIALSILVLPIAFLPIKTVAYGKTFFSFKILLYIPNLTFESEYALLILKSIFNSFIVLKL